MQKTNIHQFIENTVGPQGEIRNVYGISLVYFPSPGHSLYTIVRQIQDTLDATLPDTFTSIDNLHLTIASVDTGHTKPFEPKRIDEIVREIEKIPPLTDASPMRVLGTEIDLLGRPIILFDFVNKKDGELLGAMREKMKQVIASADSPNTCSMKGNVKRKIFS